MHQHAKTIVFFVRARFCTRTYLEIESVSNMLYN
jgi:hypothetical protein